MNRYDALSIEYASLIRAPIQEIIVRNQELGAGVGVFVGRLLVLKIVENHLRVVFSAGDTARIAWGTPDQPPPGSGDYLQTVVFDGGGEAAVRPSRIQVTTNYDVPTGKYRLVRNYDWDVTWQTFLPTPPDEIALVAAPRTDK